MFIAHRINTIHELNNIPNKYGIEIDLRDSNNKIIVSHDPYTDGIEFEEYIKYYNHSFIILNIKSEGIEYKILEIIKKYNIKDYFFLDCSFPMIYKLNKLGEKNIAIRFSEYESIETVIKCKDMVKWVWIDCFTQLPLNDKTYKIFNQLNLKICIVSPELQEQPDKIFIYKHQISNYNIHAICTKIYNIDKWF